MRRLVLGAALALLATSALAGAAPEYAMVHAGRYQAILGDCMGCHTAPQGRPFAGGLVLDTPFGKLAAPNITPDADTGIGKWSEEQFRRAMKEGIAPDGHRLYPAMPYPNYARMSDGDVANLWAYMQTVEPVKNRVRVNLLYFPFRIRALMLGWNWLFFKPAAPQDDSTRSAAWNRGAYIVNGPGHCGACHSPKNIFGADTGTGPTGASLQGWFAPDITADMRRGLGRWSVADVAAYLKTGHNSHSMASGPMAEAIEASTALMTDSDRNAIAVYLKGLPHDSAPEAALGSGDARMKAGAAIYRDNCMACHNADGRGQSVIFPPLAANPIVHQTSAETMARVVLMGTQAARTKDAPTAAAMPSFAWRLNDAQLADVLTYVRNSWGNRAGPVNTGTVAGIRARLRDGS